MTTLTDFLLARIADDQRRARRFWDEWSRDGGVIDVGRYVGPTQTLAECEAKRRIVLEFQKHDQRNSLEQQAWQVWDLILHILAAVYASHPDYQAEWAIA